MISKGCPHRCFYCQPGVGVMSAVSGCIDIIARAATSKQVLCWVIGSEQNALQ